MVSVDINATVKPAAGLSHFFSHLHRWEFLLLGIIGVVSSPMRGAWLSLSRTSSKVATEPFRAVRLTQGKQDAENASTGERKRVIDAFKLASRKDIEKARRKTMEERMQSVLTDGGAGTLMVEKNEDKENDGPAIPPPLPPRRSPMSADQEEAMSPTTMEVDDEETRFQKDLEEAIAASTREGTAAKGAPGPEAEDERLERETKMAMELSLKEEEEFERGLMEVASTEKGVDTPPPSKS